MVFRLLTPDTSYSSVLRPTHLLVILRSWVALLSFHYLWRQLNAPPPDISDGTPVHCRLLNIQSKLRFTYFNLYYVRLRSPLCSLHSTAQGAVESSSRATPTRLFGRLCCGSRVRNRVLRGGVPPGINTCAVSVTTEGLDIKHRMHVVSHYMN